MRTRGFQLDPALGNGRLVRAVFAFPLVAMAASVAVLTVYFRGLLLDAAAGGPVAVEGLPLTLLAGGFLMASAGVVLLHSLRLSTRVAGPELRLIRAMRRIREGDVSFRVNLRRGDLLTGLARECNDLLDWLNANPPTGVATGGDVVDVEEPIGAEVER